MKIQALRVGLVAIAVSLLAGAPTAAQERAPGPTTEGIEVHGHWIIEVYDGDALVDRREFENALAEGGDVQMLQLLAGAETPGNWQIGLQADYEFDGGTISCKFFSEHNRGSCYESFDTGVETTIPTSGDNADKLVLHGSFVQSAEAGGASSWTIFAVASGIDSCPSSTTPDDCASNDSGTSTGTVAITETTLGTPVSVEQGQQVNVTVIISFTG